MSRAELERLVDEAEADGNLRRSLKHCRSGQELVLAARRLGYRITRNDLTESQREHRDQSLIARRTAPSSELRA
jgi:predicted ribosomally synthesized peptide with nif11-like leader